MRAAVWRQAVTAVSRNIRIKLSGRRNLSNAIRICLSLVRVYVWLSGHWPDADWCQPAAAENLSAAEYSRRICLVADFTTIGYAGGQVIAPWLHNLDQHLKHWVWLILVVVLVVGVRWWLKRPGRKSRIIRRKTIALDKVFAPHPTSGAPCLMRRWRVLSGLTQ
ncbi:putative inner membrane protein YohD [Escherichia coli]|nr:putative inner membrane protein YohD [Escherichia coli]